MTPEDFTYWLQGFSEMSDADSISDKQWSIIKDHLNMVFAKQAPEHQYHRGTPYRKDYLDTDEPYFLQEVPSYNYPVSDDTVVSFGNEEKDDE